MKIGAFGVSFDINVIPTIETLSNYIKEIIKAHRDRRDVLNWLEKAQKQFDSGQYTLAIMSTDRAIRIISESDMLERDKKLYNSLLIIKGIAQNIDGHFKDAIETLDKVTVSDHLISVAWNNKGLAQANLNMYEDAVKSFDLAVESNKQSSIDKHFLKYQFPLFSMAYNNKGNALWRMGRYNEALRAYDKAIEISPEYASVWNNKGIAFAALGKYEDALLCFDKANETNPLLKEALYNKGILLFERGVYEDAIEAFDNAATTYEKLLQICDGLVEESYENVRQNPHGKPIAERTLESINKLNPKILEAISAYDKVFERDRSIPDMTLAKYWFSKGIAQSEIGLYDDAIKAYDKAIEFYPVFFLSLIGKGKAYSDLCRDVDALDVYLSIISLITNSIGVEVQLLMSLKPENIPIGLSIPPEFSLVLNCIGELYNKNEQYYQAIEYIRKAISWNPRLATAWENLGMAFLGLKEYENAIKTFDKAIELDSSLASSYFYKCVAMTNVDETKGSKYCFECLIEKINEKLRINQRDAKALYLRGKALFELGRYQQSIDSYEASLRTNPNNFLVWHEMGFSLRESGDHHNANLAFKKAEELGFKT